MIMALIGIIIFIILIIEGLAKLNKASGISSQNGLKRKKPTHK
jgi:hypothetical protein